MRRSARSAVIAIVVVMFASIAALAVWVMAGRAEAARLEREALARLAPERATLIDQREETDACSRRVIRKLRSTRAAVDAWASGLGLRCTEPSPSLVIDGRPVTIAPGTPCKRWYGDDADLHVEFDGDIVIVDSAQEYLCGGPFR